MWKCSHSFISYSPRGQIRLPPSVESLHPSAPPCQHQHTLIPLETSVFWGQGRGSTSNLPQSNHMKHLDCGQGKWAGRSWGSTAERGEECFLEGRGVRASGWLSLGLKKGLFECSVLSCTRQRSTHIIQRVTWANGPPSWTPLPPLSLSCTEKQKQGVPQILCLTTHLSPQENLFFYRLIHHRPHLYAHHIFYLACRGWKCAQMHFHHLNVWRLVWTDTEF